jgi:hypothetical protein
VGSGEALNERAATGKWPAWPERWERLAEATDITLALWSAQSVSTTRTARIEYNRFARA